VVAATGAGKTLSFWIALLIVLEEGEDKMIFIVTPLNLLGKQNVEMLGVCYKVYEHGMHEGI